MSVTCQRFKTLRAVHLFLVRSGEALLLRGADIGYEDGRYSVVTGRPDGDEEVITAMIREAHEEASITLAPENMRVIEPMRRKLNGERIDFFPVANQWRHSVVVNAEPHKCDELTWRPLDALPENIIPICGAPSY